MSIAPQEILKIGEPVRSRYDPSIAGSDLVSIASLPRRMSRLLEGTGEHELRSGYREGGWNVAQIAHHLVDSHMHAYARCKFALCEVNPSIKPYDENTWVASPECSVEEVPSALVLLANLHSRWVRMLGSLDAAAWNRSFHHPERNRDFLLYEQAGIYAWHGERHLAQAALALGKVMPE